MITTLLFAAISLQGVPRGQSPAIAVGWHDELDNPAVWKPLAVDNKARANVPYPGALLLSLGQVPANWPYAFQWSGVTQDAVVDVAHYPVLMARLIWIQGYAHLDIDVLDANGKAAKTLRSSTLNGPGLSTIDLSSALDPATYTLRLRLIVGGDNSGCSATYDWVRFVSQKDSTFLTAHPEWQNVRQGGLSYR